MKQLTYILSIGGFFVTLYALIRNLSPEASAMISGGILVLMGAAMAGTIAVIAVGVALRGRKGESSQSQNYQPQHPFIVLTGGQPQGGNMQELPPPQQHYLPLPSRTQVVDHEDW